MIRRTAVILLILVTGIFYSCTGNFVAKSGSKKTAPIINTENNPDIETAEAKEPPEPTRAELVMKALARAFPAQIEKIEFRSDDWAVLLRGVWYYYAGGRLLPENELENSENYRPYQIYNYPAELPPWRELTPEETERRKNWIKNRNENPNPLKRSNFFIDDLWQSPNQRETEKNMERITFLGKPAKIHKLIKDITAVVEERIREAAKTDQEVQAFINSIHILEGYGWRNIAQTQSRSYHSYGLAIDLLPKSLGKKQTYWLWTSQYRDDWWNVSYNERYHPPAAVIKAFEENGFIWGGKWPLFDTMHFEYRPEILIFNGLLPEGM